ncbi:cuticlin-6-like [Saccostrea echinata]|uniref:cuticlin-6-like n=1 Tax=Saccostrea echinata TaxID=191078 RepID=UPI002A835654|nr:cuticlin-6-like [Saccostrea echinata]
MQNSLKVIGTFYLVLQLNWNIHVNGNSDNECKQLFDIIFCIDGSDRINKVDFYTLRLAMKGLIDRLNIGEGNGRMGMVVYSRDIALEVPLSDDKEYLRRQAQTMPHPREGANTDKGIAKMREIFGRNSRRGVPMVGIVVMGGMSKNPPQTAMQASLAKKYGINMYSVGVTHFTDIVELNAIASRPSQVLTVESFDMLARNLEDIVKLVCPSQYHKVHGYSVHCIS